MRPLGSLGYFTLCDLRGRGDDEPRPRLSTGWLGSGRIRRARRCACVEKLSGARSSTPVEELLASCGGSGSCGWTSDAVHRRVLHGTLESEYAIALCLTSPTGKCIIS